MEPRNEKHIHGLREFVRRNRGAVLASTMLGLTLLASVAALWVVQSRADRQRAAAETDRATRAAATDASIAAAIRESRERVDEAWNVSDYPDRLQRATDAAAAAVRRADDYAAGGLASEATLADIASARQSVDELARHTRLITANAANMHQFADELNGQNATRAMTDACRRGAEALRQFGVDPDNGSPDDIARTIVSSRIRDPILGMLLWWHYHIDLMLQWQQAKSAPKSDQVRPDPALRDRLWQVIRAAPHLCGGALATWQDLMDRNDVPGLVAFAASPEGLSFQADLVGAMARNLRRADQRQPCRAYLRAAIDRYPNSHWLHFELALACMHMPPPDYTEALRHLAAASAPRPESGLFHLQLGWTYVKLDAHEHGMAAYRKVIALAPQSFIAYEWMGAALFRKKDWEEAHAVFQELVRRNPDRLTAHVYLGGALMLVGRHAEGRQHLLDALRRNPDKTSDPRTQLRAPAACFLIMCADGQGAVPLPPAERPAYRMQALELMTVELAALRTVAVTDPLVAFQITGAWFEDRDNACVRDPKALEQLPPDERQAWTKFWADVREFRDRTNPGAGPAKPTKKPGGPGAGPGNEKK
jgi:tetratricopeptide (TPR) repeat protein